jgi:NhaP-type Na+/H+ or K+/H+ antiporter
MTYGTVLFTLLVQGLTIAPLVRRLGLREEPGGGPHSGKLHNSRA